MMLGSNVNRELKAKSLGVFTVRRMVLDQISVDCILFDRAVPEIFYFKHDVGSSDVNFLLATLVLLTLASLATPFQF